MITLDGGASLAWRWRRHGLDSPVAGGVVGVAERIVATRAWPLELAEATFAVRQAAPEVGAVERALGRGELIQSYAFRGGSYVFTPQVGAALLAVRTASRGWEKKRWQAQGGFEIADWGPLRAAVREMLAEGPATRAEIAAHLEATPSLRHLATAAATGAGADSLYKPLHWWGDIAFGPSREGGSTFRLLREDPRWPGLPEVDDAGRQAVRLYLRAYGPATSQNLRYWLTEGLSAPARTVAGWIEDLGEDVTTVTIDGAEAYVLTESLAELRASVESSVIRLLPAYDPWVLGPGTADPRLVAPARRGLLSNGASMVLRGGVVIGTWRRDGAAVSVACFEEAGPVAAGELRDAVERLGRSLGTDLTLG